MFWLTKTVVLYLAFFVPCANGSTADTEWGQAISRDDLKQRFQANEKDQTEECVEVAIIGGGLAGLAVSIGLTRSGITCRLFERAPRLRTNSQGMLSLEKNGLAALESIQPGIVEKLKSVGVVRKFVQQTVISENGNSTQKVVNMPPETNSIQLSWHSLHQTLASYMNMNCEGSNNAIETDRSLISFREDHDSILLQFQNGKQVRARAVVAADGVFSVARRQMYPQSKYSPVYFGQLNWNSVIDTTAIPNHRDIHPIDGIRSITCQLNPQWHAFINDAGSGQTFWQVRVSDPTKAKSLSPSAGRGGLGLEGAKDILLDIVKANPDLVKVIQATPESEIFERSIVALQPIPSWRSKGGRLALLGDAAQGMHPVAGQGANSAFVASSFLVGAMSRAYKDRRQDTSTSMNGEDLDVDWVAALRDYEGTIKPSIDVVQRFSNYLGVWQSSSAPSDSSKKLLSPEHTKVLMTFAQNTNDPNRAIPSTESALLTKFNPLDQPGISRLW